MVLRLDGSMDANQCVAFEGRRKQSALACGSRGRDLAEWIAAHEKYPKAVHIQSDDFPTYFNETTLNEPGNHERVSKEERRDWPTSTIQTPGVLASISLPTSSQSRVRKVLLLTLIF